MFFEKIIILHVLDYKEVRYCRWKQPTLYMSFYNFPNKMGLYAFQMKKTISFLLFVGNNTNLSTYMRQPWCNNLNIANYALVSLHLLAVQLVKIIIHK
jgi:hypothetical protein